ncbi:MAG: hypothetical protein IJG23_06485 [Clostridia bacterium]|nr:hypothetical protein [Clostridia bacterium]
MLKKLNRYFSRVEKMIWCVSVLLIAGAFFLFDRGNIITAIASVTESADKEVLPQNSIFSHNKCVKINT